MAPGFGTDMFGSQPASGGTVSKFKPVYIWFSMIIQPAANFDEQ
jgi:hypothetical protein